jgi:Zn-dependent M28 family amino/carboxypeptidase
MTSPRLRRVFSFHCPAVVAAAAFAAILVSAACRGGDKGPTPISVQEIDAHIRYLSDDQLEGRAVGSRGIEMAAAYQEDYFGTFKLEPAFGASYRQTFDLRGFHQDPASTLEISGLNVLLAPVHREEFVVASQREDAPVPAEGELVYCGYFIQAPERNWDDLKGLDLRGKVILCEINEPGNRPGGVFDGQDMTYYGRWMSKFERATALGAAGILIIHNDKGAAYGWDVLKTSWSVEQFFLPDRNPRLYFQGWLRGDTADAVLKAAKLDRAELLAKAETPDFAPVPLGLKASVRQATTYRAVQGVNVAGFIRGKHKDADGRVIVMSAHYDHFGKDESLEGDRIYNGAVDNNAATAAMLALAGYYAQRPELLKVDLLFAGVTAEEQGMLGSDYLARHLPVPAERIAANINFEMTNVWGPTADVFAIGAKQSTLDDVCRRAAETLGLRYIPERNGELGFYFRSDQLSFARVGIPGVWLHQGIESLGEDKDKVQRKFAEFRKTKYHKVTDEMEPDWDYAGTLQILDWAREIVRLLEAGGPLPDWKPESSFRRPAAAAPAK